MSLTGNSLESIRFSVCNLLDYISHRVLNHLWQRSALMKMIDSVGVMDDTFGGGVITYINFKVAVHSLHLSKGKRLTIEYDFRVALSEFLGK